VCGEDLCEIDKAYLNELMHVLNVF